MQTGVDITSLRGEGGNISANAATQAFGEPLAAETVLDITSLFIVS